MQEALTNAFLTGCRSEVPNGDTADIHLNSNRSRSMGSGTCSLSYLNCFSQPRVRGANKPCNIMCLWPEPNALQLSASPLWWVILDREGGTAQKVPFTKMQSPKLLHPCSLYDLNTIHYSLLIVWQIQRGGTREERGSGQSTKLVYTGLWVRTVPDANTHDPTGPPQEPWVMPAMCFFILNPRCKGNDQVCCHWLRLTLKGANCSYVGFSQIQNSLFC